jgi:hypothetical protein
VLVPARPIAGLGGSRRRLVASSWPCPRSMVYTRRCSAFGRRSRARLTSA